MGAQHSTRKLTIDNENPTSVLKVSESVVERLKGRPEAVSPRADLAASAAGHQRVPAAVIPIGTNIPPPVYPQYMYEPSQTSIQVRQEKEELLKKNDVYWQNRLNKVEETHKAVNKLMEQEYNEAMTEVKGQWLEATLRDRKPVCQEGKRAVLQCYQQHTTEPMRCAREVQAFAACVDKQRFALVANRG